MPREDFLKIGITCYPSVGGSGILATCLGEELALRGHQVHFISYEHPFRLSADAPGIRFHPVQINDYGLFRYPDYTLPLSVKMAEVCTQYHLDVLHVHYAVPHATAALLACLMLPRDLRPAVVVTLHGTDTTLLGRDAGYGPAIRHALAHADAITAVSRYLRDETNQLLDIHRPIEVIHNFFSPRAPQRTRQEVRRELGVSDHEIVLFHASNLRRPKRIDLLLETVSRIRTSIGFKLLILAGDKFAPFLPLVEQLGLTDRLFVRENVLQIEDYLQAADIGLYASENESFCLSILEGMFFSFPSIAPWVGGIPEVIEQQRTGLMVPFGATRIMAENIVELMQDPQRRRTMGELARLRAQKLFSAEAIIPQYKSLYRRVGLRAAEKNRIADKAES